MPATATDAARRAFKLKTLDKSLEVWQVAPPTIAGRTLERPRGVAVGELSYQCSDCESEVHHFWVLADFDGLTVQKVGQHPALDISIPVPLEKLLNTSSVLALYRKGAVTEAHGYGIGAFAYYRRVVESVAAHLIDKIEEAMPPSARAEHATTLALIRAEQKMERRIQLAAKVLPGHLSPDGRNPLDILFTALSQGLHQGDPALDDGECLERARIIRKVLTFLTAELASHGAALADYTVDLDGLLKKIADAGKKRSERAEASTVGTA